MQEFPSRSEKRLTKFYTAAEKGCMSLDDELLYSSEIKRYIKQGFVVSYKPSSMKNLNNSNIDWSHAFKNGIPHIVFSYITGVIVTYPESHIKTFAQQLYVIAARANRFKK